MHRSEPCLARFTRCRIWCGACTQPTRTPGANTFETVPTYSTRPESSRERRLGRASPSNRSRAYGSSSITSRSCSCANRTSPCRRVADIVAPAGFWNVGITYRNFALRPSRASRSTASASRSSRIPSASTATWWTSAPEAANTGTAPGYVGPSARTASPGSTSTRQSRSSACWPPVVTISSAAPTSVPSSAIRSAIAWRSSSRPSVGPYWSARGPSFAVTSSTSSCSRSAGNALVSGRPPASEITSGRDVIAIRSRIADDRNEPVRCAYRCW